MSQGSSTEEGRREVPFCPFLAHTLASPWTRPALHPHHLLSLLLQPQPLTGHIFGNGNVTDYPVQILHLLPKKQGPQRPRDQRPRVSSAPRWGAPLLEVLPWQLSAAAVVPSRGHSTEQQPPSWLGTGRSPEGTGSPKAEGQEHAGRPGTWCLLRRSGPDSSPRTRSVSTAEH